jgi:beta-aspartyl-peptidase (threonine type)
MQYFIRLATASTIARRARLLSEPLEKAAQHAVDDLRIDGGLGGVIALDRCGNGKIVAILSATYSWSSRKSGYADELLRDVSWGNSGGRRAQNSHLLR